MVKRKENKISSFSLKTYLPYFILLLSILGLVLLYFSQSDEEDYLKTGYHIHADFLVSINGELQNFSDERYMDRADFIHLHDGNGLVVHYHKANLSFSEFLSSLDINVTSTCLNLGYENYCSNSTHSLRFFVNETEIQDFESYVPEDLDRILLIYGNDEEELPFRSISEDACIYSEKCPERGPAPPESCSGTSCSADIEWLV